MSLSRNHQDLFHHPTLSDHLNLFQSLLDAKDLTSEKALALHNIIRTELERPQQNSSSVYRRYSQVMESLRRQMPEVYEQVFNGWQQRRQVTSSVQRMVGPERTRPTESEEGLEEPRAGIPENAKGGHATLDQEEPRETLEEEGGEPEEEHEEPEEEEEAEKEETEKEEEFEEESEEETGKEEEKEKAEKEESEEEKEGEKEEEDREEKTEEEEKSEEEVKEKEEEPEEKGAAEQEEAEVEPEAQEEAEAESEAISESAGAETEVESEAESDHMAAEAAEAATEAEEGPEAPELGEEEPPMEAE